MNKAHYLDMTPKAWPTKNKLINWTLSKVKSLLCKNNTVKTMKKQATDWLKIFSKHVSDKKTWIQNVQRILDNK